MDRVFYTFKSEPREQVYRDLIDYAVLQNKCKYAFLIVRNEKSLSVAGEQALQLLAPYLLEVQEVSEWPGTKLYRHTATLYKYNVCPAFSELLKNLAQGLYEWEHPDLPEDLGFMLTEKLPWLFTIAHERDAVLCLTAAEVDDLMADDALASILTRDKNYDEG